MALIPIPCDQRIVSVTPPLVNPPPGLIFGTQIGPKVFVSSPVTFDFSPLFSLGQTAAVQYYTYDISCDGHDWAMASDPTLSFANPFEGLSWSGCELVQFHSPPPASNGYYEDLSFTPTQKFDQDFKTSLFDTAASPGFGSYSRYFAQPLTGAVNDPFVVIGPCAILPVTADLNFEFRYYQESPFLTELAYATYLIAPTVIVANLTAWCQVDGAFNCTGDCGTPVDIPSGTTGDVCVQGKFIKTSDALQEGVYPPGNHPSLAIGAFDPDTCTVLVEVGCMSAETLAANMYQGPWTAVFSGNQFCTVNGVGYTYQFTGQFTISKDIECEEIATGNPFSLQDHHGRYHVTGTSGPNVFYKRSNFGTNAVQGWDVQSGISAIDGLHSLHDPRVIVDDRQSVRLAYALKQNDGAFDGVIVAQSDDDGATWAGSSIVIEGGSHPTVAYGQDGTFDVLVLAAYVGPDGGPGTLMAVIQAAGDAAFGDPFMLVDDMGNPLSVADDTFHIQQARDDQSRWMLHVLIDGDSATSQYTSYDECQTWAKVT